jgi:organic hydroperoxide reductase OsmC/OhrA
MSSTTIEYRMLPETRAAVGRAGYHSVIADRPDGKAGGMGLGFNGGELLALAIGGCFCNDLQVLADESGKTISDLSISVTLEFGGTPSRTVGARMSVDCNLEDGSDPTDLIERAKRLTNIGNSVRAGIPLEIESDG